MTFHVGQKVWVVDSLAKDLPTIFSASVQSVAMRTHRVSGAQIVRDDGFSELRKSGDIFNDELSAVTECFSRLSAIAETKHQEWSEAVQASEKMKVRLKELEGKS